MPTRGRPRSVPQAPPPPGTPAASPYTALYPPDKTQVDCRLCQELVTSIASHLVQKHPTVRLEEYRDQFPDAKVVGEADTSNKEKEAAREITVTPEEAAAHPGGREAAMMEKTLDQREQAAYRSDVEALLLQGHKPSHQLASVAYLMTLARRVQLTIELTRDVTAGQLYHSEALETFHSLEAKITSGVTALEKIRAQRVEEASADPLAVVEAELEGAEAFVQGHIGEFQHRCPGCALILLVPAVPHWAYQPLKTDHGLLWPVWSPEMWKLVLDGSMALAEMAYCLRTSPEGLQYTAAARGEPWPEELDIEEAEAALRVRLLADDRGIKALPIGVAPDGGIVSEGEDHGIQ